MTVLRSRPFRSVHLERGPHGAPVVVKRYHHPGRLRALLDGARARRELAALAALAEAGLPVPEPLGVSRGAGGAWELRMAAVPGARDVATLVEGGEAPPGGWERLSPRLGRLLARIHALGFRHGDLHPGNVVVDGTGAPWLVDVQRVRRGPVTAARRLAAVAECEAAARELLPAGIRARFLVAWLRAAPGSKMGAAERRELAERLRRDGRERRVRRVAEGLGRWLRESSRVRAVDAGGRRAWLRRDLNDAALARLAPRARDDGRTLLLREGVLPGGARELESRWLGAARLHEHHLPAARPALLVPGEVAVFEVPERRAASRAELLALLEDRGLALHGEDEPVVGREGAWFRPPRAAGIAERT